MAEEKLKDDEAGEETGSTPPKKSKKGLFIIIGIVVLALIGGGVTFALLTGGKGNSHEAKTEEHESGKPTLVALDPFILNLSEQGRFLKVTMQMELADAADQHLVDEKTPQLRDAIITLMSSKSVESVSSAEGKLLLKDELLVRANQAVGKEIFKNLYFTEFVMQ